MSEIKTAKPSTKDIDPQDTNIPPKNPKAMSAELVEKPLGARKPKPHKQ